MHLSRLPLALCFAAAVSLSGSGMAADKKHDNDNGRSDRVVRRATSPVVQASVGRGNSQSVASVRHLNGSGNRQQFMASARNGGGSDIRQFSSGNLASVSPR